MLKCSMSPNKLPAFWFGFLSNGLVTNHAAAPNALAELEYGVKLHCSLSSLIMLLLLMQ